MIIHPPQVSRHDGLVRVTAPISFAGKEDKLWFEVDAKYEEFLSSDRIDSFLIALLPLAMTLGEDIQLEHPVSQRVYFNTTRHLIPMLAVALPGLKKVIVTRGDYAPPIKTGKGPVVGLGLSCGVDSMSTLAENLRPETPSSHRITPGVFTNVGSNGPTDSEAGQSLMRGRMRNSLGCATELGLGFIFIDSNLQRLNPVDYDRAHTYLNAAAVLMLERLICRYYYSAGHTLKDFRVGRSTCINYDPLICSYVSTDLTDFVAPGVQLTRTEKTRVISDFEPAYRWLNVCSLQATNCSHCEKCLRTQLTLDVLGKLDRFDRVFKVEEFPQERRDYTCLVLAKKRRSSFCKEIVDLMGEVGYRPTLGFRLYNIGYRLTFEGAMLARTSLMLFYDRLDALPRAKSSRLLGPVRFAITKLDRVWIRIN